MRLDARKGDYPWFVWIAPEARSAKGAVWVDDETAQWCELHVTGRDLVDVVHQVRKIQIIQSKRLVLIDPVEGADDTEDVFQVVGKPDEVKA